MLSKEEVLSIIQDEVNTLGLNQNYVPALLASAGVESNFNPTARQQLSKARGATQAAIDFQNTQPQAEYLASDKKGKGWGLFQFDEKTKNGFAKWSAQNELDPADARAQIRFALMDATGSLGKAHNDGSYFGIGQNVDTLTSSMNQASSPEEAALLFRKQYIRPGVMNEKKTVAFAQGLDVPLDDDLPVVEPGTTDTQEPVYVAELEEQEKENQLPKEINNWTTVGKGDTLTALADSKGMTVDELLQQNPQIKDPNKINVGEKIYTRERDFMSGFGDFVQPLFPSRLGFNSGGLAEQMDLFAPKDDIETIPVMPEGMMQTSVDFNNPEAEQMRKAFATETLPEIAPVTGDVLAVKNYPEDISTASELVSQGVDEGELSTLLGGVALGAVSTLGLLPSVTGVGALGKIGTKAVKKATKDLVKEVGEDASTKIVDTVGEATQPVKALDVEPPKKTVKAYKLFKTDKNGNLFPLFVKMGDNKPIELNKWTKAEAGAINEKTGKVKSSLGDLAYRPGFHAGDLPIATHIGGKSGDVKKPNYRPDNQVWAEVEMADDTDWQSVAISRARKKKDGNIDVKTAHITDQIPEGGHYRYKTNPNMTGEWLIGGELKVNRILSDDEVKKINDAAGVADLPRLGELNMAEGGAVMQKQMEMFNDGGLLQEGGTVDPVSGNDVPVGSTQEEVRDDIPAQLSEGEFVFPADVVRFIGLEKLMQMRQQAKAGLQLMDDMGQMGNSEEATVPDDIPFSIEDLEMDDEPAQFNQGGMPTQYAPPSVAAVPTAPQYTQIAQPKTPEVKTYVDSKTGGNPVSIMFVDGKPQQPIPAGYVLQSEYKPAPVQAPQVAPVQVQQQDGESMEEREAERQRQAEIAERAKERIAKAKEFGYTEFENPFAFLMKGSEPKAGTMTGLGYVYGNDGNMYDPLTGDRVPKGLMQAIQRDFLGMRDEFESTDEDLYTPASKAGLNFGDTEAFTKAREKATDENERMQQARARDTQRDTAYKDTTRASGSTASSGGRGGRRGPRPETDNNDNTPASPGTPFSDIKEKATREDRFGEAGRYMNEGGYIDNQMKKSGLTSKK